MKRKGFFITLGLVLAFTGHLNASCPLRDPLPCTICKKNPACENCSYTSPLIPYPNPYIYPKGYKITTDSDTDDPYGNVGYRFA